MDRYLSRTLLAIFGVLIGMCTVGSVDAWAKSCPCGYFGYPPNCRPGIHIPSHCGGGGGGGGTPVIKPALYSISVRNGDLETKDGIRYREFEIGDKVELRINRTKVASVKLDVFRKSDGFVIKTLVRKYSPGTYHWDTSGFVLPSTDSGRPFSLDVGVKAYSDDPNAKLLPVETGTIRLTKVFPVQFHMDNWFSIRFLGLSGPTECRAQFSDADHDGKSAFLVSSSEVVPIVRQFSGEVKTEFSMVHRESLKYRVECKFDGGWRAATKEFVDVPKNGDISIDKVKIFFSKDQFSNPI